MRRQRRRRTTPRQERELEWRDFSFDLDVSPALSFSSSIRCRIDLNLLLPPLLLLAGMYMSTQSGHSSFHGKYLEDENSKS